MKRLWFLFIFALLLSCGVRAAGEEAVVLNERSSVTLNGQPLTRRWGTPGYFTTNTISAGSTLRVSCPEPIGGIVLRFYQLNINAPPRPWTLTVNGETLSCGEEGYLHQFAGGFSATELTLTFPEQMPPCSLCFLSEGTPPDWVQIWDAPLTRADVLLLPTHSDDDQLYFAGVIPWCQAQGATVQVAYLVEHYGSQQRMSELLDGLWSCGLRHYPVLGVYYDIGNFTYESTLNYYRDLGVGSEDFVAHQVALLRRFQPQVVVTHAIGGEYGHGAHILNCLSMLTAVTLAGDAGSYPDSAAAYGVWDPPKLYVHNYEDHQIHLDLDSPLEALGGDTPIARARRAFLCHQSQLQWYQNWLCSPATAAAIYPYNPGEYGLYRSTVGDDSRGDSFFDHIVFYAEQERLAAEAEAARIAAEAQAARQAAEDERQAEAARQAAALAAREEADRQAALAAAQAAHVQRQHLLGWVIAGTALIAAAALAAAISIQLRERRERRDAREQRKKES